MPSTNDPGNPGLDHYAIRLSAEKNEVKRLKNHLIKKGVIVGEKLFDVDKFENSSFYVYDPDGIRTQFLFR